MARVTQFVLLCEGSQDEAFALRFLEKQGIDRRRVRVEKSPGGRGAGEAFVRREYPVEVARLRRKVHVAGRALIVMIDEDTQATQSRRDALDAALADAGLTPRGPQERIVVAVPERNIETWLTWLGGDPVDEETAYPRLRRARDCYPMADRLAAFCQGGAEPGPAPMPPSLAVACEEFRARVG